MLRLVCHDRPFCHRTRRETNSLLADSRVTSCYHHRLSELVRNIVNDTVSGVHHRSVRQLLMLALDECPVLQYLHIPHEQVGTGNTHVGEDRISHIRAVQTHLDANVAGLDAWHRTITVKSAELNNKRLHTIVLMIIPPSVCNLEDVRNISWH